MAIYRPTPDFKGRTFKLCVLTRWDFNFCVRSSPLRGQKDRDSKKDRVRKSETCSQLVGQLVFWAQSTPTNCLSLSSFSPSPSLSLPRSGELRTQKLKSHLVRTQSLNVLPLKPGVGQYIAIHATLTVRDFFLPYFYHSTSSSPFTCIFSKTSPDFSYVGCG